ncbi:hypothetical protein IVB33_18655 [Bradyrhizobium sp. 24]|uniref:hypothetical protein n=1 Tax=unclassified Bradyrhizobium TaxID=2631580 RepID=UPI001FF863E3|nr:MULTISPECIES: hypothetical protein [unclassified Bradyrhizobium]MCK1296630.1 hypothetical protein [Bradyrhizobium sp. 37]MCK1379559.1 hypothetical protein [Bradyrhizobium sp. 24]MCK1768564.1 hypothetical protein [Bradyrhizobium sp. 134]
MPELASEPHQLDRKMWLEVAISMNAWPNGTLSTERGSSASSLGGAEAVAIGVARGGHDRVGGAAAGVAAGREFGEFAEFLQRERGLAPTTIIRHLPFIRRRPLAQADVRR